MVSVDELNNFKKKKYGCEQFKKIYNLIKEKRFVNFEEIKEAVRYMGFKYTVIDMYYYNNSVNLIFKGNIADLVIRAFFIGDIDELITINSLLGNIKSYRYIKNVQLLDSLKYQVKEYQVV